MKLFKSKRHRALDKVAADRIKLFDGTLKRGDRVRVKDPFGIFSQYDWFVIIMDEYRPGALVTGVCLNTCSLNTLIQACDVVDWISAEKFTLRNLPWGARNPTDLFVDDVSGTRFDKGMKSVHNP